MEKATLVLRLSFSFTLQAKKHKGTSSKKAKWAKERQEASGQDYLGTSEAKGIQACGQESEAERGMERGGQEEVSSFLEPLMLSHKAICRRVGW